jgi:tetratricopeptide (TPR) repeat protein
MRDGMDAETMLAELKSAEALSRQAGESARARLPQAAAEAWTQAAGLLRGAVEDLTLQLAQTLEFAAVASLNAGQPDAAAALAAEVAGRLTATHPAGELPSVARAFRLARLGQLFCALQLWDAASASLTTADEVLAAAPDIATSRLHVQCLATLATAQHFAGRHQDAVAVFERAAARAETIAAQTDEQADRLAVIQLQNSFGRTLLTANRPDAAAGVLLRAVTHLDGIVATEPAAPLRNLLAATLNKLGHAHAALGERAAAATCLDRSVGLMRVLVEDEGQTGLDEDLRMAIQDRERLCA